MSDAFIANLFIIWAKYAASIHAVLDRFGQIKSVEELNGAKFHRFENILTMSIYFYSWFDKLQIWLEKNPHVSPRTNIFILHGGHQSWNFFRILMTPTGRTQSIRISS